MCLIDTVIDQVPLTRAENDELQDWRRLHILDTAILQNFLHAIYVSVLGRQFWSICYIYVSLFQSHKAIFAVSILLWWPIMHPPWPLSFLYSTWLCNEPQVESVKIRINLGKALVRTRKHQIKSPKLTVAWSNTR